MCPDELAWLWPLEQVPGQPVWPQLGYPSLGLALLGDWTLSRLASWGSEEALQGSRVTPRDWREGRGVLKQLQPGEGFLVDLYKGTFGGWGMESLALTPAYPKLALTGLVRESLVTPYASQLCPSGQTDPVIHPF